MKFFMNIEEISLLGCMTTHNSSNQLTLRFLRHFSLLSFAEYDKD